MDGSWPHINAVLHLGLSFLSDSEGSSQSVGPGLEAGLC